MKGNNGRAARRLLYKRLAVVLITFATLLVLLSVLFGSGNESGAELTRSRNVRRHRQGNPETVYVDLDSEDDDEIIKRLLHADLNLVEISKTREFGSDETPIDHIDGIFCTVNFDVHKKDPSTVPMFRDVIAKSPACEETRYRVNLSELAKRARKHDKLVAKRGQAVPKPLDVKGVVFHESRCGSTLVANNLIAMDPVHHRVYSENSPCIQALRSICGETYGSCSMEEAAALLRNVVYLMSRTNDEKEQNVFFKIQSAASRNIEVFQEAFPETPWIYVYRDPVQVMMSHMKYGEHSAKCLMGRQFPPPAVQRVVREKHRTTRDLTAVEYCAAHLASLTESAVAAMQQSPMGRAVNYVDLPNILYEDILPNHFEVPVSDEAKERMIKISGEYSKSRGKESGQEWHEDSEAKEAKASPEVREAAELFLEKSYNLLLMRQGGDMEEKGDDGEEEAQEHEDDPDTGNGEQAE